MPPNQMMLAEVLLFGLLSGCTVGIPLQSAALPAMCQPHHDLPRPLPEETNTLQLSAGCTSADCPQFSIPTNQPFATKDVNWTAATANKSLPCDQCNYTLEVLQVTCKNIPDFTFDVFIGECVARNVDPYVCTTVYDGVAALFCPQSPCLHITQSLQWSPHAMCHSGALNCDSNLSPDPPEKALLLSEQFVPVHPIPPLSCQRYVTKMQSQCDDPFLPQWKYCLEYDGFVKSGCEYLAQLIVTTSFDGDICQNLFNTPPPTEALRSPLNATSLCLSLGFPDQSPLPFVEWAQYQQQQQQRAVLATPKNISVQPVDALAALFPTPSSGGVVGAMSNVSGGAVAKAPCIRVPQPTPVPRGIVSVFERPIGYRTLVENKSLIGFSCLAASSWVTITPKIGCLFTDWNVQSGGFGDMDQSYPCGCRCSNQTEVCGRGPGTMVYWSDVTFHEDCAKMICSNKRFDMCEFGGTVVATDAFWNGETVRFTSISLQEKCQGASATEKDFCGIVADLETTSEVPRTMGWTLKSVTTGAILASSGNDFRNIGSKSTLRAKRVWVPCGEYSIDLIDNSWSSNGWANVTLVVRDDKNYVITSVGGVSGNGRLNTAQFSLTDGVIKSSRVGLCPNCAIEPQPCYIPVEGALLRQCVPFASGTTNCPAGALQC